MVKKVTFSEEIQIRLINNDKEERKSFWGQMAIDRERFKRRIEQFEILFKDIVKLSNKKNNKQLK